MKITLGLMLLASLTSSAFAQTCRGSNCKIAGGSAAGMMVAGATAIRGSIAIRDIEKRFTRTLMQVSPLNSLDRNAVTDRMVNQVRPGDKVVITYSKSNHLNLLIQENMELEARIQELDAQSRGNVMGFHSPSAMAAAKAEKAQLISRLNVVKKQFALTRSPVTKIILDANDNVLGQQIKEMLESGKSIYSIKRVPGSVMQKIGRASRNGYVLAATAVALGLVTVEELSSGRIARKLDGEFNQMK